MSLIDPEILKTIANRALRRRDERNDRAVPDADLGGRCAGGGTVPCSKPAEFTVTSRDGSRYDCCRDHLQAFAAATNEAGSAGPGLLARSRPAGG